MGLSGAGTSGGAVPGSGGAVPGSGGAVFGNGGTSNPANGGSMVSTGGAASGGTATGNGGTPGTGGATAAAGGSGATSTGGSAGSFSAGGSSGGATTGGASASGGAAGGGAGKGGSASKGGAASGGSVTGGSPATGGVGGGSSTSTKFSFFVTSVGALKSLSGSDKGFGGDLRFGEATGLAGADKICATIAEKSLPGAGQKTWRAFLSTTTENAAARVGAGPWYDRMGRIVAASKSDLLQTRPRGADPAIINDLPNETGLPNHLDGAPGCSGNACPDNHDTLTGSKADGTWDGGGTCADWTSTVEKGAPRVGHSWPASSGMGWAMAHTAGGCGAGINLVQSGGAAKGDLTVGAGGGYGGFYCFALTP